MSTKTWTSLCRIYFGNLRASFEGSINQQYPLSSLIEAGYFLGAVALGGVPLDSHENSYNLQRSIRAQTHFLLL